jgi:hypothetical protein
LSDQNETTMTLDELTKLFIDNKAFPEEIRDAILLRKYTAYTDGNSVLYVPLNGEYVENLSKVGIKLTEMLLIGEVENKIMVSDLEIAISSYKKHEKRQYADCLFCDGSGNINIDFNFKGKAYKEIEIECPECDGYGQGAVVSKTIKYSDYDESINIDGVFLNANYVERLILVAKYNNQKEIKMLTNPHPKNPVLFKCKEIIVLIMPMINQQGEKPFVKISNQL